MFVRICLSFLLGCVAAAALGVEVPPTAKEYEPVVLIHEANAQIQVLPWKGEIPRFLEGHFIKRPSPTITVFCAPPGAYLVFGGGAMGILIVSPDDAKPEPPPKEPDPPTDPDPDPDPIRAVETVSYEAALSVNDPPTLQALITGLENAINTAKGQTLDRQVEIIREAITVVMLQRKGDSQQKDWLNKWRNPVNAAMEKESEATPYLELMGSVIAGLKRAATQQPTSEPQSKVTIFFRENCPPCELWKSTVDPVLRSKGWRLEYVEDPTQPTPTFEISAYGSLTTHVGFMSVNDFSTIVSNLKNR